MFTTTNVTAVWISVKTGTLKHAISMNIITPKSQQKPHQALSTPGRLAWYNLSTIICCSSYSEGFLVWRHKNKKCTDAQSTDFVIFLRTVSLLSPICILTWSINGCSAEPCNSWCRMLWGPIDQPLAAYDSHILLRNTTVWQRSCSQNFGSVL